jgi:hypothetical protein
MLRTYATRSDVTRNIKKFWKLNKALIVSNILLRRNVRDLFLSNKIINYEKVIFINNML